MRITRNVYLLYAIALLQGMVFYSVIATLYRQAHGLTLLQITTIESISLVLAFLFEVPWGIITYALAAICSFFITEVQSGKKRYSLRDDFFAPCKTILKNKVFLGFLIGIALLNETHQTVTVYLSQLQYLRAGISTSWMGVIYILVSLAGLVGVYSARLTQKLGAARFARLLYGSMVAACVLLANLAFGAVADAALPAAFGLGAVFCAVGFVLFIRYYRGQFVE